VEAYGLVIDPVTLVTDIGRMERHAGRLACSAGGFVARLAALYRDNLNASLKSLQLAQGRQESETGAAGASGDDDIRAAVGTGGYARRGAQSAARLIDGPEARTASCSCARGGCPDSVWRTR